MIAGPALDRRQGSSCSRTGRADPSPSCAGRRCRGTPDSSAGRPARRRPASPAENCARRPPADPILPMRRDVGHIEGAEGGFQRVARRRAAACRPASASRGRRCSRPRRTPPRRWRGPAAPCAIGSSPAPCRAGLVRNQNTPAPAMRMTARTRTIRFTIHPSANGPPATKKAGRPARLHLVRP